MLELIQNSHVDKYILHVQQRTVQYKILLQHTLVVDKCDGTSRILIIRNAHEPYPQWEAYNHDTSAYRAMLTRMANQKVTVC